jgi:hypothetical protein
VVDVVWVVGEELEELVDVVRVVEEEPELMA